MIEPEGLVNLYGRASAKVTKALLAVNPARYSAAAAGQAMVKTQATVKALNEAATAWADDAIDSAWAQGARTAKTILEVLGKKPVHPARTDPRQALKDTLAETLLKANASINTTASSFLALTAMGAKTIAGAELQEFDPEGVREQMADLATKAVKNESSRKALAGQIRSSLSSEISAGNLININGKAWRADRYAEMVARTTLREAQTEATLELCREYENDLVQWSDHGTVCMACHEYEGNIYSISGKHPTYPPLTESPPLHPNCEHSLLPTTDVALDLRKAGPGKAGWLDGAAWLSPAGQAALKRAAAPKRPSKKGNPKKGPKPKATTKPLREWTPAKTLEEAEQWAREELCRGAVDYSKCNLDIANLINREMDELRKLGYKFDTIVPTNSKDAVAYVWRRGNTVEFAYNSEYMKTIEKLKHQTDGLGISTCKGTSPQALLWHERGHALDDFWCISKGLSSQHSRSWQLWGNWKEQFESDVVGQALRKNTEAQIRRNNSGSYMWCKTKEGGKNVHEFFAEAYRLYKQGALPSEMEYMNEIFRVWGW